MTDDTWMDTENRSEKPIDVQALWVKALKSIENLAPLDQKIKKEAGELYTKLKKNYSEIFWNGKNYFYDTIHPDGKPDPSVKPNALAGLIFDLVPNEKAKKAVERISQPDILTSWGIRTRAEGDPLYVPYMYHSGEVWGSTTGWGALAAFVCGARDVGMKLLSIQVDRILKEGGMYAECYRGDKPELYQSCILQAWSLSTYLWCILEKLFGISKKALEKTIDISPRIPKEWKEVKIKNVVVGNAILNMEINGETKGIEVENVGKGELIIRTSRERKLAKPGKTITIRY
jgi:glycogen debranching enzyme